MGAKYRMNIVEKQIWVQKEYGHNKRSNRGVKNNCSDKD